MSNSRKLFKSALWGQVSIAVQLISGLIIMPLMVSSFGVRDYGVWVLGSTVLGYFGLLEFGFSKATLRFVSQAIGEDDKRKCDGWITIGVALLSISSIIGFVLLLFSIYILPFFVAKNDIEFFQQVLLVVGISFFLELPSKGFMGVLQAHVRGDVIEKIISSVGLLRILLFFGALFLKFQLLAFFVILGFTNLFQGFLIVFYSFRINGGVEFQRQFVTKERVRVFIDYSGFSFVGQLSDMLRFQAYPFIVSSFLGLSQVTIFQIANRIRLLIGMVHSKTLVNLTAVYSQLESVDSNKLAQTYLLSYKFAVYFVSFTIGITMLISPYFIRVWMGEQYSLAAEVLIISLVGSFFAGVQIPTVSLLFGTSKHRFYALTNGIEAILIISASIILVKHHGLIGMVIGASLATLIVKSFIQPILVVKALGLSVLEFHWKYSIRYMIFPVLFFSFLFPFGKLVLRDNFINIAVFSLFVFLIFFFLVAFFCFKREERKVVITMLPTFKR